MTLPNICLIESQGSYSRPNAIKRTRIFVQTTGPYHDPEIVAKIPRVLESIPKCGQAVLKNARSILLPECSSDGISWRAFKSQIRPYSPGDTRKNWCKFDSKMLVGVQVARGQGKIQVIAEFGGRYVGEL